MQLKVETILYPPSKNDTFPLNVLTFGRYSNKNKSGTVNARAIDSRGDEEII